MTYYCFLKALIVVFYYRKLKFAYFKKYSVLYFPSLTLKQTCNLYCFFPCLCIIVAHFFLWKDIFFLYLHTWLFEIIILILFCEDFFLEFFIACTECPLSYPVDNSYMNSLPYAFNFELDWNELKIYFKSRLGEKIYFC